MENDFDNLSIGTPTIETHAETAEQIEANSAVIEANPDTPAEQKPPTRRELGRLRRQYFTRELPTVTGCGHKADPMREPKNNCQYCWFTFFNNHGELVQAVDELWRKEPGILVGLKGNKFAKNFLKFMATLAQWKATADAAKAAEEQKNESSTGSVEGSSGAADTAPATGDAITTEATIEG